MSFFNEKKSLSRRDLRKKLKRDKGVIPGTGGKRFSSRERENLSRDVFGSKHGSNISKRDAESAIRDLERQKQSADSPEEEESIDQKIRYLEDQLQ